VSRHVANAIEILCAALVKVEAAPDAPGYHQITLNGYVVGKPMPYDVAMRRAATARTTIKGALETVTFVLGLGSDA
jgi:hypothetical protein